MLKRENTDDHCSEAEVHREHHQVAGNAETVAQEFVFHLKLEVALALLSTHLALLHLASEHNRHGDREKALEHQSICAHVEALLRPSLRRAVHGVHLQSTHT